MKQYLFISQDICLGTGKGDTPDKAFENLKQESTEKIKGRVIEWVEVTPDTRGKIINNG